MSIQAVAWALDQDLPARPKLVLVSIANHADHRTGYCWLKAETIASESACTPRSVFRFIGGLVRNGYIRKAPRKGADGKQRANDYWIMFGREEVKWDWGAKIDDNEDGDTELGRQSDDQQDVVAPDENLSPHEITTPYDSGVSRPPSDQPALSHGPHDNRVSRYESLEPSESNPKKDAGARLSFIPRNYRPPPPEPDTPQGSIIGDREAKSIFVFEGSRAYEAWCKVMSARNRIAWCLATSHVVDGKSRRGWWFPTLFPPQQVTTGPPTQPESLMPPEDEAFLESTATKIR